MASITSYCIDRFETSEINNNFGIFYFPDSLSSRYSTVQKTLLKDNAVFTFEDGLDSQQMFGLVTNDLTQIKPNYEAMVKGGTLRITDEGYAQGIQSKYLI